MLQDGGTSTPKGYIIVRGTVTDPDAFAPYGPLSAAAMQKYGVKVLIRNGRSEAVEGEGRPRNIIIEAESYEAARAFFSPEYQVAAAVRKRASVGEIVIVELGLASRPSRRSRCRLSASTDSRRPGSRSPEDVVDGSGSAE